LRCHYLILIIFAWLLSIISLLLFAAAAADIFRFSPFLRHYATCHFPYVAAIFAAYFDAGFFLFMLSSFRFAYFDGCLHAITMLLYAY